jgi:2-polyprenyl-6-methoxyphenol hydroxylase-like FAD-dependent oxidoreductase
VRRQALKAALLQAVGPTPVHFGRHCTAYRQSAKGIEVLFEDGTSAQADYLVACDGVSSALRQQMLGDAKHYLGLTSIFGEAPVTIQHPLLQGGYFMMLGDDGTSFFCYRQPDSIHASYVVRDIRHRYGMFLMQRDGGSPCASCLGQLSADRSDRSRDVFREMHIRVPPENGQSSRSLALRLQMDQHA